MTGQRIRIAQSDHDREAVVLVLQKYLVTHWIRVMDDSPDWVVSLEGKEFDAMPIDERAFFNELLEAEFLVRKDRQTAELRRVIIQKALSPYCGEK